MSLHWALKGLIDSHYAATLSGPSELKQDALVLGFESGLELELRYVAPAAYSFHWVWGEVALRIDTAPVHPDLATTPNHLHDSEGRLREDPLTRVDAQPWDNVQAVLDAIQDDPLLERIV